MIVLNLFAFFSVIVLLNRPLHGLVCGGGEGGSRRKKLQQIIRILFSLQIN